MYAPGRRQSNDFSISDPSENQNQANEWTRDTLAQWGLSNAHLENWGPFGRGWTWEGCTARMTAPPGHAELVAIPEAWTAGTGGVIRGSAARLNILSKDELEKPVTVSGDVHVAAERVRRIMFVRPPLAGDRIGHGQHVGERREAGVENECAVDPERACAEHLNDDFRQLLVQSAPSLRDTKPRRRPQAAGSA